METVVEASGECPFSNAILKFFTLQILIFQQPSPVAAGNKTWVCERSLAGISGSNPAGAWMCVSCECCVLSGRGLCDGHIARPEVTSSVVCQSVIMEPQQWGPRPLGLSSHEKIYTIQYDWQLYNFIHAYFVILPQQQTYSQGVIEQM
jgi:hypothetical protein